MSALQPFSRVAGFGEPGLQGGPNKTINFGNLGTRDEELGDCATYWQWSFSVSYQKAVF